MKKNSSKASIIVTTKNNENTIDSCLSSIKIQSYPNIELIVVDNNSKDSTKEIAKKFTKLVFNKGPERSAQRNFGVSKSSGKFVMYIDSDQELEKNVIKECVQACESKGFDAIVVEEDTVAKTYWSKVRALERQAYVGSEFIVAARFLKKSAFEKLKGFDENLTGQEDSDLHNRLLSNGFKIGRRIKSIIHHHESDSLKDAARTFYYYGNTWARYIKKHPDRAVQQYFSMRFLTYLQHWSIFARNPLLAAGFLVRKPVEYVSAILGVANSKIWGSK